MPVIFGRLAMSSQSWGAKSYARRRAIFGSLATLLTASISSIACKLIPASMCRCISLTPRGSTPGTGARRSATMSWKPALYGSRAPPKVSWFWVWENRLAALAVNKWNGCQRLSRLHRLI